MIMTYEHIRGGKGMQQAYTPSGCIECRTTTYPHVLVGVVVVIPIVLVCKKKKRLSRNGLPSGKFLLMTYCNWRIIKFHPKQMTN